MRLPSILGLVLVVATAAGQRSGPGSSSGIRSGPPTLTFGNPFTSPGVARQFGAGSINTWGVNRWPRGANRQTPILYWYGQPFFNGPGFYPPFYPPYGDDVGYPYQSLPQRIAVPQLGAVQPPPPDFEQPENIVNTPAANPDNHTPAAGSSGAGEPPTSTFKIETVGLPERATSVADEYHPPIIVLKNNWAYSVNKYWTEGKVFHFVTTQGEHMRVRAPLVDRIYPGSGRKTNR